MFKRAICGGLAVLSIAALAACSNGDSESACASRGGVASVHDIPEAIRCDFGEDVREVSVGAITYTEYVEPKVDTSGMGKREARLARDAAVDAALTKAHEGTRWWGGSMDDNICPDVLHGSLAGGHGCVIPDSEIPALNALTAMPKLPSQS